MTKEYYSCHALKLRMKEEKNRAVSSAGLRVEALYLYRAYYTQKKKIKKHMTSM